ncbi:hypothetical protein LEP1GSC052_0612 [Leptospira kmetyi serovar Malaysia str. Bejo-Iso9]|nr:hypothetical protein LEP1GSC052_0612 [Leptospira kmetyi serovar Malaysia str. Bejo-Iso9]
MVVQEKNLGLSIIRLDNRGPGFFCAKADTAFRILRRLLLSDLRV